MIDGLRRLMRGETTIDFIGRTKIWAMVSASVIAISLIALFVRKLDLSLEFEGGTSLSVPVTSDAGVPEFQDALEAVDVEGTVQILGEGPTQRQALIRTQVTQEDKLRELQAAAARTAGQLDAAGNPDLDTVSRQTVGPSWGQQITNKAIRGLIVFLILVSLYISFRFEWKMAAGALAALFHDLLATAGVYALVGFEVSPATVIALLTLMGYSLYDTVVVFDRVRENDGLVASQRISYAAMVNRSINEVLMRSVNTSISSVLPVGGLLFVGVFLFGAVTLKDLALAMFVGTLVSTYSSIFVAAPILAALKGREARFKVAAARPAGPSSRARTRVPAAPVPARPAREELPPRDRDTGTAEGPEDTETPQTPARGPLAAPQAHRAYRPRGKKRRKRR